MQMINVLQRLAELDKNNPNIINDYKVIAAGPDEENEDQGFDDEFSTKENYFYEAKEMTDLDMLKKLAGTDKKSPVSECGGMMGQSSAPSTPASISMTAASGQELSGMLKDIMSLAGMSGGHKEEPPVTSMGSVHVLEPAGDEMGPPEEVDSTSSMRNVLDKLNSVDSDMDSDLDSDDEKIKEYDNEPDPMTKGYDASVPSGNDMHKQKKQYPAAQPGDNAMTVTFESLMGEYKKFVSESQSVAEGLKLIGKDTNGSRDVKIYRDPEFNEFVVKFYVDGQYQSDADYHTDDKNDAIGTAKLFLNGKSQSVDENTGVTDYNPKSQGGTRKELIAKYHKTKDPKDAEAARKAGATQKELQNVSK